MEELEYIGIIDDMDLYDYIPLEWYEQPLFLILTSLIAAILIGVLLAKVTDTVAKRAQSKALAIRVIKQILLGALIIYEVVFVANQIDFLSGIIPIIMTGSTVLMASIGFAAQGVIANVLAGIAILLSKPFKMGDEIKLRLSEISGTIVSVNLRHTVILTHLNTLIMIPNSTMNNDSIENFSAGDQAYRQFIDFKVEFDSDIDAVIELVEDLVRVHPYNYNIPDDFESILYIRDMTEGGIELRLILETENKAKGYTMASDIRRSMLIEFPKRGIDMWRKNMAVLDAGDEEDEENSETSLFIGSLEKPNIAAGTSKNHGGGVKEKVIKETDKGWKARLKEIQKDQ